MPAFVGSITVGGSTITNVGAPVSATDAANKGYVDGMATRAFSFTTTGLIGLGTSQTKTIASLNLGAGTYVVMGRGEINHVGATTTSSVNCRLVAGTKTATMGSFMVLGASGTVGKSEVAAAFLVHTFAAPGQAVMECTTFSTWGGCNVAAPQLVALKIQTSRLSRHPHLRSRETTCHSGSRRRVPLMQVKGLKRPVPEASKIAQFGVSRRRRPA